MPSLASSWTQKPINKIKADSVYEYIESWTYPTTRSWFQPHQRCDSLGVWPREWDYLTLSFSIFNSIEYIGLSSPWVLKVSSDILTVASSLPEEYPFASKICNMFNNYSFGVFYFNPMVHIMLLTGHFKSFWIILSYLFRWGHPSLKLRVALKFSTPAAKPRVWKFGGSGRTRIFDLRCIRAAF